MRRQSFRLLAMAILLFSAAHANGVILIEIDIKPGKEPNSINPASGQKVPVAILTTETFDATTVDATEVGFGPSLAAEFHGKGHIADIDLDGDLDLLLHFAAQDTGLACPDSEATLMAKLFDGTPVQGTDSVSIAGCDYLVSANPGDFCTQTQGAWGSAAAGLFSVGDLRDTYFDSYFPTGLVVGDPDGPDADGWYAILLTTSYDVEEFLPTGGTPTALSQDYTNPTDNTISGVLSGRLVAATLNLEFDANGVGQCTLDGSCDFAYPPGTLGSLVFNSSCVAPPVKGLTVNDVVALANVAIAGGDAGVSIETLAAALSIVNQEFVDCDTVIGCLLVPID